MPAPRESAPPPLAPFAVPLWPEGAPGALGDEEADRPSLTCYLAGQTDRAAPAVLVFPGGGYSHLAVGHEGQLVVQWLNAAGIAAFILRYRHGPRYLYPAPAEDAYRAVRTVRAQAKAWRIDSAKIGVMGFSAGGHLASVIGVWPRRGRFLTRDAIERTNARPDFLILAYPLISLTRPNTHRGSLRNLLGTRPDPALKERLSSDLHVTPRTPPTFLFHTSADRTVSPLNSVWFYEALRQAGVPAELHIYEQGKHGQGIAPADPALAGWPDLVLGWLRVRGILTRAPEALPDASALNPAIARENAKT